MRQLKITKQITRRESESLEKYLQEISLIDLLTPEQEVDLTKKIKKGDQEALEVLVQSNLRFVISVAKQYQFHGLDFIDLINEGNVGLIKAAKRFDETRGFKFISYAVWWVRQSIMEAIVTKAPIIRNPVNKISDMTKITRAEAKLEQEKGRKVTLNEIADSTEISANAILQNVRSSGRHVSMDSPFVDETSSSLLDIVPDQSEPSPDSNLKNEALKKDIDALLQLLTPREAEILRLHRGIGRSVPMTFDEIAKKITPTITRERVRQIYEAVMKKLRNPQVKKKLRIYL